MRTAISINGLNKTFNGSKALNAISLDIAEGEFVALIGASGSGKSTLLRHISGFIAGDHDSPSHVSIYGQNVQQNGRIAREVRKIRASVGFIFQQFNLVGRLPLITNVLTGILHRVPLWRSLPRWLPGANLKRGFRPWPRLAWTGSHGRGPRPSQAVNSNGPP